MRTFIATVLGVIAAGVLLIAYGLLAPRAGAVSFDSAAYSGGPTAVPVSDRVTLGGPGPQTFAPPIARAYPVNEVREYVPARTSYAPRRAAAHYDAPRRDWQKTAMVIGGSTAAGAGLGAIIGGGKGALIGAAIGGGASTLYETRKH